MQALTFSVPQRASFSARIPCHWRGADKKIPTPTCLPTAEVPSPVTPPSSLADTFAIVSAGKSMPTSIYPKVSITLTNDTHNGDFSPHPWAGFLPK